jgi:hypothetical protein
MPLIYRSYMETFAQLIDHRLTWFDSAGIEPSGHLPRD